MTLTDYFITDTRTDGTTFVKLADDAPDWLRDAVQEAHDGEWPDDWRCSMCESLIEGLEAGDEVSEIADTLVDIYNADRARWVLDNISRGCIEVEVNDSTVDAFTVIGLAQYETLYEMGCILESAINDNQEDE